MERVHNPGRARLFEWYQCFFSFQDTVTTMLKNVHQPSSLSSLLVVSSSGDSLGFLPLPNRCCLFSSCFFALFNSFLRLSLLNVFLLAKFTSVFFYSQFYHRMKHYPSFSPIKMKKFSFLKRKAGKSKRNSGLKGMKKPFMHWQLIFPLNHAILTRVYVFVENKSGRKD